MKVDALGVPDEVHAGHLDAGSPRGTISWTPLQYACALGDDELAHELLDECNVDPNEGGRTKFGYAPLHVAVRFGHMALVDRLLDAGAAEIVPTDSTIGASPLHLAAVTGNLPVVEKLLASTAHVPTTKNGTTPYELAKRVGHVEIAQLLLNHEKRLRSKQQLDDWLASIGLMEYAPRFHAVGFDDAHFLLVSGLSDATLDAMNIDKPGHRMKLKSLYQLKEFLLVPEDEDTSGDESDDEGDSGSEGEEDEDSD